MKFTRIGDFLLPHAVKIISSAVKATVAEVVRLWLVGTIVVGVKRLCHSRSDGNSVPLKSNAMRKQEVCHGREGGLIQADSDDRYEKMRLRHVR